jgi:hypothetical protein
LFPDYIKNLSGYAEFKGKGDGAECYFPDCIDTVKSIVSTLEKDINSRYSLNNYQNIDELGYSTNTNRKYYGNTTWANDFVEKFKLNPKTLHTDFDKRFAERYKAFLRKFADIRQWCLNNPDIKSIEEERIIQDIVNDIAGLAKEKPYLSADVEMELIQKLSEFSYFLETTKIIGF